jgi:hypothetical protein
MKTYVHLWQYLAEFFLEWEIFQTKFVDKIITNILFSITFFVFENRAVYETTMVARRRLMLRLYVHFLSCIADLQSFLRVFQAKLS